MGTTTTKELEIARMADLRARQFVLSAKLDSCETGEEFQSICRELDIVSHRLECIKVRRDLRGTEDERMRMKIVRSSKEFRFTKTHR